MAKQDSDNRSDQLNPNNDAFWQACGFDERPEDWDQRNIEDAADARKDIRSDRSPRR